LKCRLCLGTLSLYNDDRSNGSYKIAHHWLQPVDLGHLSGATDEACRRRRNPVNILRIIRGHVNQAASRDVHYRDICVTCSGCEVHRTLAESAYLSRKVCTFNSRFNDPDLAAALRNMTSLCGLKLVVNANSKVHFQTILTHLFLSLRRIFANFFKQSTKYKKRNIHQERPSY
jgi:hypothetical protein